MGVSKNIVANTLGVKESKVCCANCDKSCKYVNAYICSGWGGKVVAGDDFCSYWKERRRQNI